DIAFMSNSWKDDVRFLIDNPRRQLWELGKKASEHFKYCRSPEVNAFYTQESYQQSTIAAISVIHAAEDVLFCLEQDRQPEQILADYMGNGVITWISPSGER